MKLKYFGTDGIRGFINDKLNFQLAYNVGKSIATVINIKNKTKSVVIGKDTRTSGDLVAYALACGLIDYGVNVVMVGIVPTGCISYLASKLDVGFGVMITASHNVPTMNGIKVISNLGYKLTIEEELEIEKYMEKSNEPTEIKGKILVQEHHVEKYIDYIVQEVGIDLTGINVALDCAYGSNYKIAPLVFKKLNANVIVINDDPAGEKINVDCGALNVTELKHEVLKHKCMFGFAFDGDADRLIVVNNLGEVIAGDDLIYIFANYLKSKNKLNSLKVVGTVMTNMGTERSLNLKGIELVRTGVGDRNVIEEMLKHNYAIGGESSGHVCLHHLNTTCDALINCVYLLKIVITNQLNLNEYLLSLKKVPLVIVNLNVSPKFREGFDENKELQNYLSELDKKNLGLARIVVRPSGTEAVLRIMVESDSEERARTLSNIIKEEILKMDLKK